MGSRSHRSTRWRSCRSWSCSLHGCRVAEAVNGSGALAENRLTSVTRDGDTLGSYSYDGAGDRYAKTVGASTTAYTLDLASGLPQVLSETTGSATTSYAYAGGPAEIDLSGTTYWYVADPLGSIRLVTDAAGDTPASYNYSAFGSTRTSTGSLPNELRFAGERTDAETGLQYLRARTYDPTTGTFLQRDSADGGSYVYAGNSPVNAVDPSGHSPIDLNRSLAIRQQILDHFCSYLGGANSMCPASSGESKAASGPTWPGWLDPFMSAVSKVVSWVDNALGISKDIREFVDWAASHRKEAALAIGAVALAIACVVAPEICGGIIAGAAWGGGISAGFYGLGCSIGQECSVGGFAESVAFGAVIGGFMGGASSAFKNAFGEAEGAASFGGCSFAPETTVAMADGTSKPISKLRPGDLVEAYDPSTGQTGPHRVTAVMVNRDPATEHLVLDTGAVETTPNHPFYTTDRGWTEAGQLRAGERIRTATGTDAVVVSFTVDAHPASMWDITVAGAHSFFVGSGEVLVHNCPPEVPQFKVPSGSYGSSEVPSWAMGRAPRVGQSGSNFATELMNEKYGVGVWPKAPGKEWNMIKKWADRHFRNP